MNRFSAGARLLAVLSATTFLSSCGGVKNTIPSPVSAELEPDQAPNLLSGRADSKIQHVVIVIQENRSFNNLFYGFPGAKTATYGYDHKNDKIVLKPISIATKWDLAHQSQGFLAACNGTGKIPGTLCRMNGFDKEPRGTGIQPPMRYPMYSYVPQSETKPLFDIAKQYVLADEMFTSNFDASSFVSHQYIISAQAGSTINYPTSFWGCQGNKFDLIWTVTKVRGYGSQIHPCFDNKTLGDELDQKRLPWAFYATPVTHKPMMSADSEEPALSGNYKENTGIWAAYETIKQIYNGPDWNKDIMSPPSQFLTDVSRGHLRTVTWITPTWADSDHPGSDSTAGPSWVASIVNAVGKSKFWDSTAIFVIWDDYGGFYDPAPPAYVDYDGLGIRVPLLIVSAYAKKGHVSHVHYEHGSILKFIEDRFGLARLQASDTRANSPLIDCFDFSKPPRKFVPIKAPYDATYFENEPLDFRAPDDY